MIIDFMLVRSGLCGAHGLNALFKAISYVYCVVWSVSVVHQLCDLWSARGHKVMARRHTCFGLAKVSAVLTGVLTSEMDNLYCITPASCEDR